MAFEGNKATRRVAVIRYRLDGFPPANIDWEHLVPLIGMAHAELGRYDELVTTIPNPSILLSPLMTQEAILSSRIEGTNASMSDVLKIRAGNYSDVDLIQRGDAEEIWNYCEALTFATEALQERPLSQHLLREAHAILMRGVRGQNKNPGTFRRQQNWIGPPGCPIEKAHFIPIPQKHLRAGMDRWEEYVQDDDEPDELVQLAIIHAEFEALHPFEDGNGRLGRMIIPLFLHEREILRNPSFYMSGYLEAHREQYMEALQAVSRDGEWTAWCAFFLEGLIKQALEDQTKVQKIRNLYKRMQQEVADITHSRYSSHVVDFIFWFPIFSMSDFVENSGIPRGTAARIIRTLCDEEVQILWVLHESAGRRSAVFVFPELLGIVDETYTFRVS